MPKPPAESALYVKIPTAAVDKLRRAAEALGVHNKDLVAGLVARYVDPDSPRGLDALATLSSPRRITIEGDGPTPTVGAYSFQPYETPPAPEVLSVDQAARFLQVDDGLVIALAESGQLPGRKLGSEWRFSRAALVGWLAQPDHQR